MGNYVLIEKVERLARKGHRCIWCGEPIPVGSRYKYERCVYSGDPQSNHWHPECDKMAVEECANEGCDWEYTAFDNPRPKPATVEGEQ